MATSEQTSLVKAGENSSSNISEIQNGDFKLQLVEKLTEIDRHYKEGVFQYKESIQAYNIEIEKLKNQIDSEREYCDKEEKNLLMIDHELLFESKAYDKLQVKFAGFLNSIEELQNDYKDILEESQYTSTLKRKEKELFECLDDIELFEISLLNKELERLNLLESLEPKQVQLKRVKTALKELEMEKTYFESMGLHNVSSIQLENKSLSKEELTDVVDTVEIKE